MKPLLAPLKNVIAGPVGAGKSTFVRTLSETPVVSTDEFATEPMRKVETTVALDFGTILFDDQPLHLFGTPGQDRFEFMWEILCDGASGLILLVAGDRPQDFPKARHILDFISSRAPVPFMIGVTWQDSPRAWNPGEVAEFFQVESRLAHGLDARIQQDGQRVLYHLFECLHHQKSRRKRRP